MQGMREGDGGRATGIPSDEAARKGEGGTVELGSISHGRRAKNISDTFPDQGRAKEFPCGEMPRKGWETDGDEDAFLSPAYPGHRDHLGGGIPTTPKVIMMRHAGPMAVPK